MTAIEETGSATASGKSTHDDGVRPSVGDATRALSLPHLPYVDAVHAELTEAGLVPDVVDSGVRVEGPYGEGPRQLIAEAAWLPGNEVLAEDVRAGGLVLQWSHLTGWSVLVGDDLVVLDVDKVAEPLLLADAVQHLARRGPGALWVVPFAARWEHAVDLDAALAALDEWLGGAS